MTTSTQPTPVEVTPEDKAAADFWWNSWRGLTGDYAALVDAFARHRQPDPVASVAVGEKEENLLRLIGESVSEQLTEGSGFWRHCSGCIGTKNPRSSMFQCDVGMGCRECGGLGMIWDDTDYDAMARAMLADDAALSSTPVDQQEGGA